MSKNLSKVPTSVLFNWLECLFSGNNTVSQIQNTMVSLVTKKEVYLPPSFMQERVKVFNSKLQSNNEAIKLIEKEIKKRMKVQFPNIAVLSDIDMLSKSVNDEIEKHMEKEEKKSKGLSKA